MFAAFAALLCGVKNASSSISDWSKKSFVSN
jgi:hypothetical protein